MAPGGFVVDSVAVGARRALAIAASDEVAVLYGVFHLLRHLQTGQAARVDRGRSGPRFGLRMLDHWDNLDGTIERGYAGRSLWHWDALPDDLRRATRDYARANASIGINGVGAEQRQRRRAVLTAPYLRKVAALADVFRPYGIRVYLSRALQRAHRDRRPDHRRPARPRRRATGGRRRPTRSTR